MFCEFISCNQHTASLFSFFFWVTTKNYNRSQTSFVYSAPASAVCIFVVGQSNVFRLQRFGKKQKSEIRDSPLTPHSFFIFVCFLYYVSRNSYTPPLSSLFQWRNHLHPLISFKRMKLHKIMTKINAEKRIYTEKYLYIWTIYSFDLVCLVSLFRFRAA